MPSSAKAAPEKAEKATRKKAATTAKPAKSKKPKPQPEPISNAPCERKENLQLATDSAIRRLKKLAAPGGEIDEMDIKDLKNLISSIKELSSVSAELSDSGPRGGVIILPEVKGFE